MPIGTISTTFNGKDVDVEWRIDGFTSLPEEDRACYLSPVFSFRNQEWYLVIYPNGWSERDSSGYVDLQLCKYYSSPSIEQEFSLSFKTVNGEKYLEEHSTRVFEEGNIGHTFLRFLSRSELLKRQSKLVSCDVLTVICTMKNPTSVRSATEERQKENSEKIYVAASTQTREGNEDIKELLTAELNKADTLEVTGSHKNEASGSNQTGVPNKKFIYILSVSPINLSEERDWMPDINDFLKEGRGVDVTFELETPNGKTEFFTHQIILALKSPYFLDKFYDKGGYKGHRVILLKGIDPKAFEQMIRHCYDYNLSLKTSEDACALFKVAFKFKLKNLQNLCRTFIRDATIDSGNVFSVLKVSEKMIDKSLRDMCYKILQDNTRQVMANYDLCDVTPAMVHTLLDLPKLSLKSEYELIKWIFDWAKVKSENTRQYLEKLLKDMNFLSLTFEEFGILCKDNPEFFSLDEMGCIYQNVACPGTKEMPAWYDKDVKCRVYTRSKG